MFDQCFFWFQAKSCKSHVSALSVLRSLLQYSADSLSPEDLQIKSSHGTIVNCTVHISQYNKGTKLYHIPYKFRNTSPEFCAFHLDYISGIINILYDDLVNRSTAQCKACPLFINEACVPVRCFYCYSKQSRPN